MPPQESRILVAEPLLSVVDSGDVEGLEELLRRTPNLDLCQPYDDFRTPSLAHRVVELGHTALLRAMLALRRDVAFCAGLHGATLVHLSARRGNVDALSALLAILGAGALAAADNLGWTPLHDAAMEGHVLAVKYVVRRGADVDRETSDGQTASALSRTSGSKNAAAVADWLDRVSAAGGIGRAVLAEQRYPWILLRLLAERGRAAPSYVYAPTWLAFAGFLIPTDSDGAAAGAKGRRRLPRDLLPLVLRFLY